MQRYIYFFLLLLVPLVSDASVTSGTIDSTYKYARICHDESCSTYGTINFKPTINGSTPGATAISITDSGITGHAWGDEVGWINFSPTGQGVTLDSATGALSGMAYANTGGWINFNPTSVGGGTAVDVTINTDGEFEGWAWISGAYGGWIQFDCGNAGTCVKTDWRPESERSSAERDANTYGSQFRSSLSTSTINIVPSTTQIPDVTPSQPQPNVRSPQPPQDGTETVSELNAEGNDTGESPENNIFDSQRDDSQGTTDSPSFTDNEQKFDPVLKYRLTPIFGPGVTSDTRPDCRYCFVVHTFESEGKQVSVLKWNFIPEFLELRIPLPRFFTNQDESLDALPIGVDVTSIVGTIAIPFLVVGYAIVDIFNLLFTFF